jgi:flagella basal body P-ring formation protein FlgA
MNRSLLHCLRLALVLFAGSGPGPSLAQAGGFQSVQSIEAAALASLPAGTDAEATLDPSLRLPLCSQPLQASPHGRQSVEVSCSATAGWRLFVPVRIRRSQEVLVLVRGIAAGQPVTEDAMTRETRDASRIVGATLSDPAEAVGQVARRTLTAGSVLLAGDLLTPRLVHRGDNVALVSRRGGVEVRMNGKALGDAGENQRVRVENLSSRRVVQGIVAADGEVWVNRCWR